MRPLGQPLTDLSTIYLAGPLFTQAERLWNRRLADLLQRELGCAMILPQDFPVPGGLDEDLHHREIFRLCIDALDACDLVVAILDGPDVDSGTAFEVGYAYARGKPIIGVRTDFRRQQERGTNLMLSRSCHAFVQCVDFHHDAGVLARQVLREVRKLLAPGQGDARVTSAPRS